ncbi:hypothetical protein JAB4_059310 (plasmid) [Janthinobacterium sp. HH102]|uniref:type 4b pilus protein PilO2 n=1 Tax=Janthinobacterium sp. HH102 TaxID=1537274 RepID=UPI000892AA23|nr:type 4b pilus protein PilO2 [Janthinobacterium sp. HH102]QOU76431.1 hypothetical protein JAB4_059310 [Janthinobacterium sp. HH102]
MENVIQVDDKYALAFGFKWVTLDPIISRGKQLSDLRTDYGARWLATFKINGSENIGYAKKLSVPKKIKVLSGAGQLALHERFIGKSVLVLLEDANHADGGQVENDVAVLGLINGNVVLDAFVKSSHVQKLRQEFLDQCTRAHVEYLTVGQAITIDEVDQEFLWSNLLPVNNITGIGKFYKKPRVVVVRPLNKDLPSWLLWLLLVLILVICGIYYSQVRSDERDRLQRLMLNNQKPDPAKLYADSVNQLLNSDVLVASMAAKILGKELKAFPTQKVGWRLDKISCNSNSGCVARWNRKFGTFAEFIASAPKDWGEIEPSHDGQSLSHSLPIVLTKEKLLKKEEWPTEKGIIISVVSKWQKYSTLKFDASMLPAGLYGVPPSVQPQLAASMPLATWAAVWEIKSAPWWAIDSVEDLPRNMAIESFDLSVGNEITFSMKGIAYVKK